MKGSHFAGCLQLEPRCQCVTCANDNHNAVAAGCAVGCCTRHTAAACPETGRMKPCPDYLREAEE